MPTYRDKEIDFKIAEKYYCWKQNKSSWKNQYLSSQEGEGGGLRRSVPAPHQTGRSSNLNVSGGSCDLPVQGLRVFWNFSTTQKSRLLPPTWERLDCRHCIIVLSYIIFTVNTNSCNHPLYHHHEQWTSPSTSWKYLLWILPTRSWSSPWSSSSRPTCLILDGPGQGFARSLRQWRKTRRTDSTWFIITNHGEHDDDDQHDDDGEHDDELFIMSMILNIWQQRKTPNQWQTHQNRSRDNANQNDQ